MDHIKKIKNRARLLTIVLVFMTVSSLLFSGPIASPLRFVSSSPTSPNQSVSQPGDSLGIQGIHGKAVFIGTVDTTDLPASSSSQARVNLPFLTPGSSKSPSGSGTNPSVLGTISSSKVGVSSAFEGINQTQSNCGCTPPDVQVAAGPNFVVEMVNTEGETFSKTGAPVSLFFLGSFFHIPANHALSDPKILFDASSGRWFASIIDFNFTASGVVPQFSQVVIAVSTTSDPTTWNLYSVLGVFDRGPAPGLGVTDQPIIGVSDDKFVVSVNDFIVDYTGGLPFQGVQYWVFNKGEMVAGASGVDFASFGPNPNLFSAHPVQSLSPTTTEYMVTVGTNTTFSGCVDCNPQLISVTGLPPGNVTATTSSLSILPILRAPAGDEPGFPSAINTDDTRVLDAAWFQGKLWFTLNDGCIPTGDTVVRTCVRLVQVDTTKSPALVLQNFDFGAKGQDYYYPALRIDGSGNIDVVYGFSSSTINPSIAVTGQLTTDPVNSLAQPVTLRAGTGVDLSGRYGDYFGAGVDPSDTGLVWVAGEYNSASGFGTPTCFSGSCWFTFIGSTSMVGYSASPHPSSLLIQASSSASSTVTLTSLNGFSGKVTLSSSVSATGLTTTVSPSKVTLSSGTSSNVTLAVSTSASTSPGIYVVAVTGTSGTLTRSAIVTITVPDFSLASSPSSIISAVGGSGSSTITVGTPNGFLGTVGLSVSVSPSGPTCSLNPTSITLGSSGTSSLTCSSSSTGVFNVTVTGTSGIITHKIIVPFIVAPFSISANPATLTLGPLVSGTSTINLASLGGFSGTVSLTVSASSTNIFPSLNPVNVILKSGGTNSSTLTITPNAFAVGNYTVTVTGKTGALSNIFVLNLVVKGFALSSTPSSATITPGGTGTFTITVTSTGGFTGTVSLTWSSSTGVTCSLNPASVTLGRAANSTLTCSASSGSFSITVTGTSGSTTGSTNVFLAVFDFTISGPPSNIWVPQGSSATFFATLSGTGPFGTSASVSLTSSGAGSGTSITFNPTPVQVNAGSNSFSLVTISASNTAAFGNSTITMSGSIGSFSHSVKFNVIILVSGYTVSQTTQTFTGASVTYQGSLTVNGGTSPTITGSMTYSAVNSTTSAFIDAATIGMNLPITTSGGPVATSAIEIPTSPFRLSVTCIFFVGSGTFSCSITRTLDLNHDGAIDSNDAAVVAGAVNCSQNQSCYVAAADLLATGTVTITDYSIEAAHVGGPLFLSADFALSSAPSTVTFLGGQAGTSQITAGALNGFTGSISLSVSTPSGLTCTLNPTSISPVSGSSTLTCNSTSPSTYNATLTGTSGVVLSHSITITVKVTPFSLISNPVSLNIPVGSSGTTTITVTASPSFSGTVTLTSTVSPSGPTASLSPTSVTLSSSGSATATLSVSAASASTGTYTVTITGTSGSTTVSITVSIAVSDFSLSGIFATGEPAGFSFNHVITVTSINGFTGTVNLSVSVSPNTISCTMTPTSVSLGSSATSNLVCPNVQGNSYAITVTGTSGSLSHSITGNDVVLDFTFTASPTSLTIQRLSFSTSTLTITANSNFGCFCQMIVSQSSPAGFNVIFGDSSAGNLFGTGLTKQMFSGFTDTLTLVVFADSSVNPGTYTIIVSANGDAVTHTVTFTITVPDFRITANPTTLSFKSTSSGSSTITATNLNGYAGVVALSASVSSSGLTCQLSPASITLGTSGTATLTCSGSVGTYTVTVTGTNSSLSHSASISVTVTH